MSSENCMCAGAIAIGWKTTMSNLRSNMNLYNYRAEVIRVVDGDTVILDIDAGFCMWLREERCRLSGIDAPETWGQKEPGGMEATDWLRSRLDGCLNNVVITTEKSADKFGRWLVTLYDPLDKTLSINEEMVKIGLATRYE